jgi:membrane associated rhomboid family serine protease
MFPIADSSSELKYTPYLTWILIIANVLVFFFQIGLPEDQLNSFIMQYGAIPSVISQ